MARHGGSRRAPLIVIVGPTAAGKSKLAVAVAEWLDGEVVSADAFQVYRGLDIGTAKVDADIRARVPHHCLDIVDPDEHFTAGDFAREAARAIDGVRARGRIAVVAGGSGFYIRALVDGLAPLPAQDPRWRAALEAVERRRGPGHLFDMLSTLDAEWAGAVGPADRQRVLRGLEVTLRCGVPMSALLEERGWSGPHYDATWVAVTRPREEIYERIEGRVGEMLAAGWLGEVSGLLDAGYAPDAPGLRAIGYGELAAHLAGEISLEEARRRIVQATRRYAKRQLTWFRGQCPATWFDLSRATAPGDALEEEVYRRIREHLQEMGAR